MKKNPVLLKRFKNIEKQKKVHKKLIIAIIGTAYGVGSTHTSILIGNYLAKKRSKVSIIELNNTNHFSYIEEAYEGLHYDSNKSKQFNIKGVTYFKNKKQEELIQLLSRESDYFILDIGNNYEKNFNEFLRADISVVIAMGNDWKRKELYDFYDNKKDKLTNKTIYCIPYGLKEDIKEITSKVKGKVISIPYHNDPYIYNKNIANIISKII